MLNKPEKQQGIVLVASLISLLVVSLVVTLMVSTSGIEVKMATNAQMKNQTFQAAETGIVEMLGLGDDEMFDAIDGGIGGMTDVASVALDTARLRSESQMTYMRRANTVGNSLDASEAYVFEIEGRGYIDDNATYNDEDDEASTRLLRGVYRIVRTTSE